MALSVGMLLPTEAFHMAASIPGLAAHYRHHVEEHESTGLADFILEHAFKKHPTDTEHPDEKVPLDHHHSICGLQINYIPLQSAGSLKPPVMPAPGKTRIDTREAFRVSGFSASIWQPPKTA